MTEQLLSTEKDLDIDGGPNVEIAFGASHAPQIFLGKQDPIDVIERTRSGYVRMAQRVNESNLDALVVIALDHIHNHFFNLVPSFTVYTGDPIKMTFSRTDLESPARPDLSNSLLDHLLANDFDPAWSQSEVLDHSFMIPIYYAQQAGMNVPIIPIIVNAYIDPQPEITRCFKLGREIAKWADSQGLRIGTLGTGGLSHYPGTDRYKDPDVDADRELLSWFENGQIDKLISLSSDELDKRGLNEMRNWAVAIAARGVNPTAKDINYEWTDHCGFAVIEF